MIEVCKKGYLGDLDLDRLNCILKNIEYVGIALSKGWLCYKNPYKVTSLHCLEECS